MWFVWSYVATLSHQRYSKIGSQLLLMVLAFMETLMDRWSSGAVLRLRMCTEKLVS